MSNKLLSLVLIGAIAASSGCTSSPSSSPSSSVPKISAQAAGKVQKVETGVVTSAKACVIEGDPGPNYSIGARAGAQAGTSIAYGMDPLRAAGGVVGAVVGSKIGQTADKKLGERPGQILEVSLDDGRVIVVVQDAEPPFVGGERVKVLIVGDEAQVIDDIPDAT